MSIDMQQFHGVFFEESHEHLEEMEQLLMELDLESPDVEQLNGIFRAAHSIKGGSGIFGFDALTSLTHVMENLLDLARQGSMQLDVAAVDTLLGNVDTLKMALHSYSTDEPIDWEKINLDIEALEAILKPKGAEADEGFGFFDNPIQQEEEAFGFFEPLESEQPADKKKKLVARKPVKKAASKAKPKTKTKAASKANTSTTEETKTDEDDDGFGFFEALPDAKNSEPSNESTKKLAPIRKGGLAKKNVPTKDSKPKFSPVSKESSTIRVDTTKVDTLVNLVGEIVITQSMLSLISEEVEGAITERLHSAITELERNTREIQEAVMSVRMLPMSFVFNRFPRVVRDLSGKLGKKVDLIIEGGTTEIDKGLTEKLVDPLTHLIRNSVDHGIEKTEDRIAAGKSEVGVVRLIAEQTGGSISIQIIDDGAGLDREKILDKAREKGIDVDDSFSNKQVWNLIFAPGFSTAQAVTDVSGRGVGMDVVKRNIESIGGKVEIESTPGEGSSFNIRLPLTLAIVDGMCVSVGEQVFVVPLVNIIESIQPTKEQVKFISNQRLLWIRDEYWPILALHETMNIDDAISEPIAGVVVLIESSNKRFGILVDGLAGQQQVVIKSLEKHYRRVQGVAGATIMGDGSVALILDVESLSSYVDLEPIKVEA